MLLHKKCLLNCVCNGCKCFVIVVCFLLIAIFYEHIVFLDVFLYDLNSTGVIDDTPKPVVPPLKIVPKEENRTGANKKTYFVCHERKLLLINILVK